LLDLVRCPPDLVRWPPDFVRCEGAEPGFFMSSSRRPELGYPSGE
jgi:hypothetical protein